MPTAPIDLPAAPGTYVLLLRLDCPAPLAVGRLGTHTLGAGVYAYAGSALGPGGLRARVGRHLRADKKPHWHIDALTAAAPIVAVWTAESPARLECTWAAALRALPGSMIPVPRFGASDCTCPAHLVALADPDAAYQAVAATGPERVLLYSTVAR